MTEQNSTMQGRQLLLGDGSNAYRKARKYVPRCLILTPYGQVQPLGILSERRRNSELSHWWRYRISVLIVPNLQYGT